MWGLAATLVVGLAIAGFLTGLPFVTDFSRLLSFNIVPDVLHERAIAWEALWGDPYRPLDDIMPEHGYLAMGGGVSPRTPVALLVQLFHLMIPLEWLLPVVTLIIVGLVICVLGLTSRVSTMNWARFSWAGVLVFMSFPVVTSISYGSVGVMLTVVLILAAWASKDANVAGVSLGLAFGMRLWPGLIVVGFWLAGRRKAAYVALVTFAGLTVLALVLPGVTVSGTFEVLTQGIGDWRAHNQNASLAAAMSQLGAPTIAMTVLVSIAGTVLAVRQPGQAIPITILTALLASPLSWPAYMLAALPVLVSLWKSGKGLVVIALASPMLLWTATPTQWKGHIGLAVLLTTLVFIASTWRTDSATNPVSS